MSSNSETGGKPRRRNARGDGQRLRAEILAAASEILDATGNEQAVTLRAVARQAGIAAPSIYPHFPDAQAILQAVVVEAFASLREALMEARRAAGNDSAARLAAICEAYLDYADSQPERYRVMFGGLWSAARAVEDDAISRPAAEELGQDVLAVLVEAMAEAARAKRSSTDDPFADATAVWLALHGLASQRTASSLFPFPKDIFDRLVRPLLRLT
ncbi:MAG: TetR/AcrR family transcriptional regulator [Rhodococcus sp. (in: high G+C Gram-positive bacteria)]